ncbi:MAG: zinc-dependent alcohol dehydrogenase family protein [Candidatus Velthaea sp.]
MKTRAAVLREFERAKPYAASLPLSIENLDLDEPSYGEVLVRIESAGVCHSDLSTVEGILRKPLPLALGHEAAGVVQQVGPGVTRIAAGDHVVFNFVPNCGRCRPCSSGRPALSEPGNRANASGMLLRDARRLHAGDEPVSHHLGVSGFAQYAVAAEESVVRIPDDVPLEIAAIFGCAALTGLGAVFEAGRVAPGTTVAIFGAGGVGLMAALATEVVGASAIIVDPVPRKREAAKTLGVRATIDPAAHDAPEQIKALTRGRGADYVIEASGNLRAFEDAIAASALGATIVAVGLPPGTARAEISPAMLVAGDRTVRGSFMGSSVPQRDIPRYVELWRRGKLPVERIVSGTIGLDGINKAMDDLASGEALRTLVLPHS